MTALIGPSGCGKSTLLRVFNRMNDLIDGVRVTGQVLIDGEDIYRARQPTCCACAKKSAWSSSAPIPSRFRCSRTSPSAWPCTAWPARKEYDDIVEQALRSVLLWDDLKDRLHHSALTLSLEQQQRLCIARVLPLKPQILLMDEPCSALDPIATLHIEELMQKLKNDYTIVIVTHNMQQAARASDRTGFLYLGKLIEFGETAKIFTKPAQATDRKLHQRPLRLKPGGTPCPENIFRTCCAKWSTSWWPWARWSSPPSTAPSWR